jgi:hypothetical protein
MRRLALTTAMAVSLFALACTDQRQEGPTEPASLAPAAKSPCPSTGIQQEICELFPATDLLKSATDYYNNLKTKLAGTSPKDAAAAASRAADLVNFTLKQLSAGKLNGGSSQATQDDAIALSCHVFALVSTGTCPVTSDNLAINQDPHSAFQACGPEGCLVLPLDKHSGVSVPNGALRGLGFIKVTPIDAHGFTPKRGPLSTPLDQYLLFRTLELIQPPPPEGEDEFLKFVTVGICHLGPGDGDFAPPTPAVEQRLQLAHERFETVELLDRVSCRAGSAQRVELSDGHSFLSSRNSCRSRPRQQRWAGAAPLADRSRISAPGPR